MTNKMKTFLFRVLCGFFLGISVVAPVGICFIIGLILFSKVIKIIFNNYPGFAYFLVFGFMCGTLLTIFPGNLPMTAGNIISCVILFLVGLFISIGFQILGNKFNTGAPQ